VFELTDLKDLRVTGRIFILTGAAAWFAYGLVWLIAGKPETLPFLIWHLCGVVPGAVWKAFGRAIAKMKAGRMGE